MPSTTARGILPRHGCLVTLRRGPRRVPPSPAPAASPATVVGAYSAHHPDPPPTAAAPLSLQRAWRSIRPVRPRLLDCLTSILFLVPTSTIEFTHLTHPH